MVLYLIMMAAGHALHAQGVRRCVACAGRALRAHSLRCVRGSCVVVVAACTASQMVCSILYLPPLLPAHTLLSSSMQDDKQKQEERRRGRRGLRRLVSRSYHCHKHT